MLTETDVPEVILENRSERWIRRGALWLRLAAQGSRSLRLADQLWREYQHRRPRPELHLTWSGVPAARVVELAADFPFRYLLESLHFAAEPEAVGESFRLSIRLPGVDRPQLLAVLPVARLIGLELLGAKQVEYQVGDPPPPDVVMASVGDPALAESPTGDPVSPWEPEHVYLTMVGPHEPRLRFFYHEADARAAVPGLIEGDGSAECFGVRCNPNPGHQPEDVFLYKHRWTYADGKFSETGVQADSISAGPSNT